jgi:hypothetical protein
MMPVASTMKTLLLTESLKDMRCRVWCSLEDDEAPKNEENCQIGC